MFDFEFKHQGSNLLVKYTGEDKYVSKFKEVMEALGGVSKGSGVYILDASEEDNLLELKRRVESKKGKGTGTSSSSGTRGRQQQKEGSSSINESKRSQVETTTEGGSVKTAAGGSSVKTRKQHGKKTLPFNDDFDSDDEDIVSLTRRFRSLVKYVREREERNERNSNFV